MAYPKSHNPFADDEEEEGFKPKNRDFDGEADDSGLSDAERRQRYLRQEVMRTAQSAVDSSHRSLGLIYESEKMGVETAEELVRQGEALKRADKMLEGMDQDLKTSQKHINSIKSVWGGLVNYFKGKPDAKPTPEEPKAYETNERLQKAMSSSREHEDKYQASHPNLRKLETGGFGAASSLDSGSSGQNGYPQNSYLKEAHHTLDKNLGHHLHSDQTLTWHRSDTRRTPASLSPAEHSTASAYMLHLPVSPSCTRNNCKSTAKG
ncbi:transcript variant X1 [Nothobranchius furzeri]|uniref:Synaptosomal-associated protein 29 n=1 Tax=Nothobranchius furzeri TaxID=105023 RepID=A0A8C6MC95_NOTFU|nr:transcript variant X1 [Nothobranchius furzeri]